MHHPSTARPRRSRRRARDATRGQRHRGSANLPQRAGGIAHHAVRTCTIAASVGDVRATRVAMLSQGVPLSAGAAPLRNAARHVGKCMGCGSVDSRVELYGTLSPAM